MHERGYEDGAHDKGIDQDGAGQADAELLDDHAVAQCERSEDQDHDGGGGSDDPPGGSLAQCHGRAVVTPVGPLFSRRRSILPAGAG